MCFLLSHLPQIFQVHWYTVQLQVFLFKWIYRRWQIMQRWIILCWPSYDFFVKWVRIHIQLGGNISIKVIEDVRLPYTLSMFLASKRCSSSGLNCIYLHQIKAYIAGYQTISRCLKWNELSNCSRPLNASVESLFQSCNLKQILSFAAHLICFSVFEPKRWRKRVCVLPQSITKEKYRIYFWKYCFKKCGVAVQKYLSYIVN